MTEIRKPKNLYEYIEAMKVRTGMYIGNSTITVMKAHLDGYMAACWLKGIEEEQITDFGRFHDFVADYYLYEESTAGWKNIILAEHYGDEEASLIKFFELFDLFRENKPRTNSKKILYQTCRDSDNRTKIVDSGQ